MNLENKTISEIDPSEYPQVVELWEASVRATHHFLKEEDIAYFKPLILETYLNAVHLRSIRNDKGVIQAFIGVADSQIEMLFVHPEVFGKGLGKQLVHFALEHMNATSVDVNEDNPAAVGFYQHIGFEIKSRSPLDATGKPFPILHMSYVKQ